METGITRRIFNVVAGSFTLGQFLLPRASMVDHEPPAETEPPPDTDTSNVKHRWVLAMPKRWQWEYVVKDEGGEPVLDAEGQPIVQHYTSFMWMEVIEGETLDQLEDIQVMIWTPGTPEQLAEAERFYEAAERIDWDDPNIYHIGEDGNDDREARAKIPPRSLDREIPATPLMPLSDVELSGTAPGAAGWACLSERRNGMLPGTVLSEPPQFVAEFLVLIENRGKREFGLDAQALKLHTSRGETLSVFPGEQDKDFHNLCPAVVELNGEDISHECRTKVALSPGDSAVLTISFPMKGRWKEEVALKLCESIDVPIMAGECDVVVLDKQ